MNSVARTRVISAGNRGEPRLTSHARDERFLGVGPGDMVRAESWEGWMLEMSAGKRRWMCFVRAWVNQCLDAVDERVLVGCPARVAPGGRMAGCLAGAGWGAGPTQAGWLVGWVAMGPIGFSLGTDSPCRPLQGRRGAHIPVCVQLGMVGYGGCCNGEKRRSCGGFDAEGRQGERLSGFLPKVTELAPLIGFLDQLCSRDHPGSLRTFLAQHAQARSLVHCLRTPEPPHSVPACCSCPGRDHAFLAFLATHTFPYRLISHSSPSLSTLQHVAPAGTPSCSPTLLHSSIICFLIYSFHSQRPYHRQPGHPHQLVHVSCGPV